METKILNAKTKLDCEHLLGKFVDESNYDTLVTYDADFYAPTIDGINSEKNIIFKFRKNYFTKEQQSTAYAGLREAAIETQNRGMAAGPKSSKLGSRDWVTEYQEEMLDKLMNFKSNLDGTHPIDEVNKKYKSKNKAEVSPRGNVWLINKVTDEGFVFENWLDEVRSMSQEDAIKEATRVKTKLTSTTTYANAVFSGIAGYFDRYPRIPYGRATAFTEKNPEKFAMGFPFLQALSSGFEKLLPERFAKQKEACNKLDSKFVIPGTVFTTMTVNKTFRTAAHRDAGDLNEGFSNLTVVSNNGKYTGGYLVFPEYRVAVDVRPGDLLLVNNHEGIHGNTEMKAEADCERISFVCYFREKMLELGSWNYEMTRKNYVEDRRKNKNHPLQRELWNGVSEGMWDQEEWYNYLESRLGEEILIKYHPESRKSSLESFF
ncbi:hypothetical protein EBU71_04170 [bacterium]|nr:hypothetical protein [Candidatus Elulimicrobium humile]